MKLQTKFNQIPRSRFWLFELNDFKVNFVPFYPIFGISLRSKREVQKFLYSYFTVVFNSVRWSYKPSFNKFLGAVFELNDFVPLLYHFVPLFKKWYKWYKESPTRLFSRTSQIMYRSSNRNSSLLLQNIDLYIFNKTRIAGKRLRRMSYKLARWFIITASIFIPKYSSRKGSQLWKISNTSKYFTKILHFYLQPSLLFENRTI